MNFTVSSSELLGGLLSVAKVIPSKPISGILENFLFELKGNVLTVTASDGETTLKTNLQIANVDEGGELAVPAKLLTDSLREFPDLPITFKNKQGDQMVDITWATGASKLPCFPAADFPALPDVPEVSEKMAIPAELLLNGINSTLYATAEEEFRPVMNGIFFDLDVESSTFVASDAHKLVCYDFKGAQVAQKSSFILHKKPAVILKSILTKINPEEVVNVVYNNKNAFFSFEGNVLVCRLIEGNYPAYKTVIPKNNPNKLIIGRQDLLNVVKRISVCSNQASNQITLKLSLNELVVSAQDLSFSISAHESITCQYDGDQMEIGFKAPFLVEILNNLPYTNVCIELSDPQRAILIVSADDDSDSVENMRALLMPVMINA